MGNKKLVYVDLFEKLASDPAKVMIVAVLATCVSGCLGRSESRSRDSQVEDEQRFSLISQSMGMGYGGMLSLQGAYRESGQSWTGNTVICASDGSSTSTSRIITFDYPSYEGSPYLLPLCGGSGLSLTFSNIEIATYNPSVLGYQQGIFEKPNSNTLDPREIEVWCRSTLDSDHGIDVFVRGSSGDSKPLAKIVLAERSTETPQVSILTAREVPNFEVTINEQGSVRTYEAGAFKLQVDLSDDWEGGTKYASRWSATIDQRAYEREMLCRFAR